MSEYWLSKKKYFCKYCEIYIADDAPSRQHHENGLRHKGSVERFVRGIYKTGEKKRKDQEEEKREMARIEQAARAAFAQDIGKGYAKPTSTPVTSSSSAPRKPAAKPSNPFTNYSTAEQLGFTDPDAELSRIRKSQGLVGDWEIVESTFPPPAEAHDEAKPVVGTTPDTDPSAISDTSSKRAAQASPEDDTREFKLRKKTATVGLGEIYDPGAITAKPKKSEEKPIVTDPGSTSTLTPTSVASRWTKVQGTQPIKEETASVPPKVEPEISGISEQPAVGLFKKRKAPAAAGRGRRQF